MFVRIGNRPRDYAWGSTGALSELLGTPASGGPEAELWLGAHPGSPSRILDPAQADGAVDLAEWIARDPVLTLGPGAGADRLPFLLKVLAAERPLSLQAHPSPEQAAAGFADENARGIPLDAPERNYKDSWHKPEMIYALSPEFEALCGFRGPARSADAFASLESGAAPADAAEIGSFRGRLTAVAAQEEPERVADALRELVRWILGGGREVDRLVAAVTRAAGTDASEPANGTAAPSGTAASGEALAPAESTAPSGTAAPRGQDRDADTVRRVAAAFPGDPGIVLALLLNRVTLRRGEVMYLPAGNIHAYLRGLGVELMASSDNVLRGGLTPKHVDVAELLRVVRFEPGAPPLLRPDRSERGIEVYRPDVPDFALAHLTLGAGLNEAELELDGPAVVVCTAGSFSISGARSAASASRGDSLYVTPDEARLRVRGAGTLFAAIRNARDGAIA